MPVTVLKEVQVESLQDMMSVGWREEGRGEGVRMKCVCVRIQGGRACGARACAPRKRSTPRCCCRALTQGGS